MALNHPGLEEIQREGLARRLGATLYAQAAALSTSTVSAVAAVLARMESLHDADFEAISEEFARALMKDRASDHLAGLDTEQA